MRKVSKILRDINKTHIIIDNTMKKKLEYRNVVGLRSIPDSRKIGGLAIAVESKSELLGGSFIETIKRDAVTDAMIKSNDIKLYMNHDMSQGTIARSKFGKGSLRLFVTDKGLEFETEVPNTAKGDEVLEGIRRGDIDACSFGFLPDSVTWTENEDGTYSRDINSFKLVDELSILSCLPAYSATEVDMRSLDDFKSYEETRADDEKKEDIKSEDDDMPEPETKDYRSEDKEEKVEEKSEEEKEKIEEKSDDEEKEEKSDEEEKVEEKSEDEDEDEDEEERQENQEEKEEIEDTEKKSEDNSEEDEERDDSGEKEDESAEKSDEDEDLRSYYQSLRSLIS